LDDEEFIDCIIFHIFLIENNLIDDWLMRQVTLDQIIVSVTVDGKEIPRKYPYIIK